MNKHIKTLAVAGVGLFAFSSCSDFLDQTSPSEMNNDAVFNLPTYTHLALNKVYACLTDDNTYSNLVPIIFGMNSDIELVDAGVDSKGSTFNAANERGQCNYNPQTSGYAKLVNNWTKMYEGIENANTVIEGIANSDAAAEGASTRKEMLTYKGEALTLRAMLYLDLIRPYGDVPMKMDTTNPDGSNIYLGKTDRDEIYERLITDLEEAIEYLPWAGESNYTTERITKGFAHGLLARIAMTYAGYSIREKAKDGYETLEGYSDPTYPTQRPGAEKRKELYQLALEHLDAIIASGVHKLNPSYENEFYLLNQLTLDNTYRENLYEIAHGVSKSGELGYTVGVRVNGKTTYYGSKGNSSGKMKTTATFFMSFDKKDLRRDVTFANFEIKEGENGNTLENMLGNKPFGIYLAKWDVRKMTDEWLSAARASPEKVQTGINVVMMRYSDVLLMYAEALNELSGPDAVGPTCGLSARDALKEVHSRAFAAADKAEAEDKVTALSGQTEFFDFLVDERAWEFCGEAVRKWDLVRWGLLSKKIDESKEAYKALVQSAPSKLYYKMKTDNANEIDPASICWYEEPTSTSDYKSSSFWGSEETDESKASVGSNLYDNLPLISAGLNDVVKNRYVFPIGSTTISDSRGALSNSYGF